MTTAFPTRAALRRTARLAIAGLALLGAASAASAGDGGIGDFLSSVFGGTPQPAAAPPRSVSEPRQRILRILLRPRPLTVRLHPAKPRIVVAQAPTKPGKVSIFEDRTLRPGDAVMMARGIRVFAGSNSWPYTDADFVGLDEARQLRRDTTKVLAQLDKLPRG